MVDVGFYYDSSMITLVAIGENYGMNGFILQYVFGDASSV